MTLRRIAPFALVLLACQAELDRRPLRPVDYAVFDPSQQLIPLPNDLALASAPGMPAGAQKELLLAFAAAGGFPNDQEVPLTIDLTRASVDPDTGALSYEAPELDPASLTAGTIAVFEQATPASPPTPVAMDLAGASYVKGEARGTLTLRRAPDASGKRNWTPGARYVAAIRGGPSGVRVEGGHPDGLQPQPTFFVLRESALAGKNLTDPHNQGLLPGSKAEKAAAGAQLETIRGLYAPVLALFGDAPFPASEIALLQTFAVEAGTSVPVDAGSATLPLPIDLLRNPLTGLVVENAAFGAAAKGLATLDGFSTTAMILAPTTAPIDAATVNAGTVSLYRLNGAEAPARVLELGEWLAALPAPAATSAGFVVEPAPITQACPGLAASGRCAVAIGLAPAVQAPVPGVGSFSIPPLDEATEYAVVVTNGVKDATGAPLRRSTFAKILLSLESLPVDGQGRSQLVGVSDEIAGQIALMKGKLAPVLAAIPEAERGDVVMAWTFRTQSITATSVALSAVPYGPAAPLFVPGAPAQDPVLGAGFWRIPVTTLDAIDPATGALNPDDGAWAPASIDALVALPQAADVPLCAGSTTERCAKLAVVHHGLGGGRYAAAAIAGSLTAAGYVVAAIDAPYHGHRAFCATNADCANGDGSDGVCTPDPAKAAQGDAVPPGACTTGALRFDPAAGTTTASGNYFISANFFRVRDAVRQDLLDQGVLAATFAPLAPASNAFTALLAANGVARIDPAKVHYVGVSLGAIVGTSVVASSPRFSAAALSVGGGPLVDVFTNAPAFAAEVDALFAGLIPGFTRAKLDPTNPAFDPAIAASYLQTLNVAKWILDPADPVNFAKHLSIAPLPSPLTGDLPQPPKPALGQIATCDPVVPNPFNELLFGLAGASTTWFESATAPGACVGHGAPFLSAQGQAQIVEFLAAPAAYVAPATISLP